jgi:bacteriocin-like protein
MNKVRKLDFSELTKTEMSRVVGGGVQTNPNPYPSSEATQIVGITGYEGGGGSTQDSTSDNKASTDYEQDTV